MYSLVFAYTNQLMDSTWTQIQSGKKVKYRNISITFLDSYLILPASLRKLTTTFRCVTQKGEFPHKFVNEDRLNYVGPSPIDGTDN